MVLSLKFRFLKYILVLSVIFSSCSNLKNSQQNLYYVKSIDTSAYKFNNIIYLKKNDSIFKVVSEKKNLKNCKILIQGEVYNFQLKSMFSKLTPNYLDYGGRKMYGDETILFEKEKNVVWGIYITPNIEDVCYKR